MPAQQSGLWRHRDFLTLWGSDTISLFGVHVTLVALPLAAVGLGASAFQLGLLTTALSAPALLLGLFVGAWVDRVRRRPLLIAAKLTRAAALASLPLAAAFGALHLAQLYAVAFVSGAAAIVFVVAYQAILPDVVPREELVAGNSALRASEATALLAGPSIGGLLVPLIGAPSTLALGALAALGSALAALALRVAERPPARETTARPLGGAIGEGLRFVLGQRVVRPVIIGGTGGALFSNTLVGIAALYVTREVGLSASVYGIVIGVGGPAALLGALGARRAIARLGVGKTMIGTALLGGAAMGLAALAGGRPSLAIALLVGWRACTGLADAVGGICGSTLIQTITPPHLLGRVNATQRVFAWGAVALGGLLGGVLGEVIGLRATVAAASMGMLLVALWLIATPLRTIGVLPGAGGQPAAACGSHPRHDPAGDDSRG